MFPWLSFSTCSAASPCAQLSRAPSTTSGSDFHHDIGLLVDGPFGRPTRLLTGQDRGGSPRFRDTSFSVRAVLLEPRQSLRLPRPSWESTVAFQVFDLVGLWIIE